MNDYQDNKRLQLAFDYVRYTQRNVFLTGKAGTGKTTFLKHIKATLPRRMIVVAPTGVAAINAGGVTIHSFFQIGFGPQIPHRYISPSWAGSPAATSDKPQEIKRFSREKIRILRSLELLVIDEISMVRADLLDAIDDVMRRYRNRYQPFGGVQLLLIGDMQQLAPVVRDEEWQILSPYYESCFFFSSLALRNTRYVPIELEYVYRQQDKAFIDLLNKIRSNEATAETFQILNQRFRPRFSPDPGEGYITLTTHNAQAQQINEEKLKRIQEPVIAFNAVIEGEFPPYS